MSILNNTQKLQNLMDKINALPEAENLDTEISTQDTLISEQDTKIAELIEKVKNKASVSYPTLSNPATAENLQEGYELIDGNGNIVVGSHVCSGGSGSSSVNTCTVTIERATTTTFIYVGYSVYDGSSIIAKYDQLSPAINSRIISNVVCNSSISLNGNAPAYTVTGTAKIIQSDGDRSDLHIFQAPSVAGESCTITESDSSSTCCFVAGTQVMTSLDGESVPIETIKNGDSVVSYNIETGESYIATVKRTIVKPDVTDIAEVYFDNGAILIMNAYHPIYTENGWRSLTNHNGYETLVVGDIAKTSDEWSKIVDIIRYKSNPIKMYTLDVVDFRENPDIEINDAFFANGIVVHNSLPSGPNSPC